MSSTKILIVAGLLAAIGTTSLPAQTSQSRLKPKFLAGPATAHLSNVAQIELPPGYLFVDGKDYRAMLKTEHEPVHGNELGMLISTNRGWSVIFEFDDVGYVKDDDKDSLNADKLLESIKQGNAQANKEREQAGHSPIEVIGWEFPPRYDATTHNLEWAIRGAVDGRQILNYNTRLLGRKGVMEVILVVAPDHLEETLPKFQDLLKGYTFETGQTYAEYRPGDKIAKYGLGALVLGGAAVGAAKLGLLTPLLIFLKKGWKLVVVAFAAIASFFKKLFTGRGAKANQA